MAQYNIIISRQQTFNTHSVFHLHTHLALQHTVLTPALSPRSCRQAQELMERTSPDQAAALKQPLSDINTRWDELLKGIVERQRELDHALLRLGQFQHALDELLVWIGRTDKTLDGLRPVLGDPQVRIDV